MNTVWGENSPDTLLDTCARFCIKNIHIFTRRSDSNDINSLCLPNEIGEKLFQVACEQHHTVNDKFIHMFRHTRVTRVSLRGQSPGSVSDRGVKYLLRHKLREIDIHNCPQITVQTLNNINKYSENLQCLYIGNSVQILPDYLQPEGTFSDSDSEHEHDGNIYEKQGFIIRAPKLRKLCIRDLFVNRGPTFFELLLHSLTELTHLDLSGAYHKEGMGDFRWLLSLPKLVSLTLHNVQGVDNGLVTLCQMNQLLHLDISQCNESRGQFLNPALFMETLVTSLSKLRSLDISGTNLAGTASDRKLYTQFMCDIAGLDSRVEKPLDFLGLYKTHNDASSRLHIPALSVSGDANEAQILVAGKRYLDRATVLESILNDLFHVFRFETCQNTEQALDILLQAMESHLHEKHIQISGSASLYYVVKSDKLKRDWNIKVKRRILKTLLDAMLCHRGDPTMMRNGCLILCQFAIPADVIFDYERLVEILLHIVSDYSDEDRFNQRAGIFLLNSLACQVDGQQKMLVGHLGAVEKMLDIITDKLQQGNCDDVMETAWSTMWNVTDETPSNCMRFLNSGGMFLFLKCKRRFPEKADLLRNMMGLLGNVAEVPQLRSRLMTKEFVEEFDFLLDSCRDGIEVSYNAAGVLAHMASDGPEAWTIQHPDREHVLARMDRAINRWNIKSNRNINYRSFAPIIKLAGVSHTPQCQMWAIWALANLTSVTPDKYCRLVLEEGGLTLMEEILNENSDEVKSSVAQVKEWAGMVRNNVVSWREHGDSDIDLEFDG